MEPGPPALGAWSLSQQPTRDQSEVSQKFSHVQIHILPRMKMSGTIGWIIPSGTPERGVDWKGKNKRTIQIANVLLHVLLLNQMCSLFPLTSSKSIVWPCRNANMPYFQSGCKMSAIWWTVTERAINLLQPKE